jgi:hypothetical protein
VIAWFSRHAAFVIMISVNLNLDSRKALLFALTAERLSIYYEHGQWPTDAVAADVANVWLLRQNLVASGRLLRELSTLSDQFAHTLAASLSREAGLYTSHEMSQSLDPNYQSPVAMDLMEECERMLVEHELTGS